MVVAGGHLSPILRRCAWLSGSLGNWPNFPRESDDNPIDQKGIWSYAGL
jgi:hypothetical protein